MTELGKDHQDGEEAKNAEQEDDKKTLAGSARIVLPGVNSAQKQPNKTETL